MKYLFASISTILVLGLFGFKTTNDDIKSQSEILKETKVEQEYLTYTTYSKNDGSLGYMKASYANKMTEKEPEKNLPDMHFIILVSLEGNNAYSYHPDNFAFPITYNQNSYDGNAETKKSIGYIPRKPRTGGLEERVVFLDGFIYHLSSYYGPTEYHLKSISVPVGYAKEGEEADSGGEKKKKKKMSLKEKLKALKSAVSGQDAVTKKLEAEDAAGKLKAYLEAASAKQKKVYETWSKSEKGSKALARIKGMKDAYQDFVNNQNSMYFKNMTGRDIYIYWGENSTSAGVLSAGETRRYICGSDYFYDFTGKRYWYPNNVVQISTRGKYDKCADKMGGKPYIIK